MPKKEKQLNFSLLKPADVDKIFGSNEGKKFLDEYARYYRISRKDFPKLFKEILVAGHGLLLGFHWQGKKKEPVGVIHFNETPGKFLTVATFVRPKYRRQGMAEKMSLHLSAVAAKKSKEIVRLSQSKRMEKLARKMREKPRTLYRGGKAVGKAETMTIEKRGMRRDVVIKPRPRSKPKRTRLK